VRADNDAAPSSGARTTGSTSPGPTQHGLVTKTNFNDLVTSFPVGVATTTTTTVIGTTTTTTLPSGESLHLTRAKLRGQSSAGSSNGSARLQGDFTTPPDFTFPPTFTVRVQDGATLDRTHTFSNCRTASSGRIACRDTAGASTLTASFKPFRRNPGVIRFKVSFQRQAISAPFAAPVRMTLTHNGGVMRTGVISNCRATVNGLQCRQL
jgi:hypothetical protein